MNFDIVGPILGASVIANIVCLFFIQHMKAQIKHIEKHANEWRNECSLLGARNGNLEVELRQLKGK